MKTRPRHSLLAGSLVGCIDSQAGLQKRAPHEAFRGWSHGELEQSICALRLTDGPVSFLVGNLVRVQQDPSAFHLTAGDPLPDHAWVPGLMVRLGKGDMSLGVGSAGTAQLGALVAFKLSF